MIHRLSVFTVVTTAIVFVSAAPADAQDQKPRETSRPSDDRAADITVRGRVQSSQGERIVVRAEDGRTVTVNAKDISAATRGLVQTGEPIIVTGVLAGDHMDAQSLTVAVTAPGARALAGQPPFAPEDAGAASPSERDQQPR